MLSLTIESAHLQLVQMSPDDVDSLAHGRGVAALQSAGDDALPPRHAAAHAHSLWASGVAPRWCLPYLVIDHDKGVAVGTCRFKGAPVEGRVEIGYGVATAARRGGVATVAVRRLVALAIASEAVREVVALILPGNAASVGVVAKAGFTERGTRIDHDGEIVLQWVLDLRE